MTTGFLRYMPMSAVQPGALPYAGCLAEQVCGGRAALAGDVTGDLVNEAEQQPGSGHGGGQLGRGLRRDAERGVVEDLAELPRGDGRRVGCALVELLPGVTASLDG